MKKSLLKLRGRSEHSLDDKGRAIIPIRFRESLKEEFMLVLWPGPCIRIYPISIYDELEVQLRSRDALDESDADLQMLQRILHNGDVADLDPQFRLTLPKFMRNRLDFGEAESENIVMIGMGDKIEIWSVNRWSAYTKTLEEPVASSAAARLRSGFRLADDDALAGNAE